MSTSIRFEVFGKVQGVWFRKYTMQEAKRLGIVGWVKNTRHLSVVGVAQGNTQDVKQFENWLRNVGSPLSRIDRCEIQECEIQQLEYDSFGIVRDSD